LEVINILLMIIRTAVNWVETHVLMESHKKSIDRFAEELTRLELVEEIEMLRDMVFHLSLVNSEHAWTLKLAQLKSLKLEMFQTSISMDGLTGSLNHLKI